MSALGEGLRELLRTADLSVAGAAVRAVGVSAEDTRAWLGSRQLAFVDGTNHPGDADLRRSAAAVVASSGVRVRSLGALTGLVGLWSLGPEIAVRLAVVLRLAQRLAVVFGIDPATPRGHAAVLRALAGAFDVELADGGLNDQRASALVHALVPARGRSHPVEVQVARAAIRSSVRSVVRPSRVLPLWASGRAARANAVELAGLGERMTDVFARLVEAPITTDIVDAEEVVPR